MNLTNDCGLSVEFACPPCAHTGFLWWLWFVPQSRDMLFRLNCDFKLTVDARPVVCLYDVLVQGVSTFHPTTAHPPENGCMGHQYHHHFLYAHLMWKVWRTYGHRKRKCLHLLVTFSRKSTESHVKKTKKKSYLALLGVNADKTNSAFFCPTSFTIVLGKLLDLLTQHDRAFSCQAGWGQQLPSTTNQHPVCLAWGANQHVAKKTPKTVMCFCVASALWW